MTPLLSELALISATRMVNGVAEGIVIVLLAWVLVRTIGRRNASTRFAVWFAALLGIVTLPWIGVVKTGSATAAAAPVHSAVTLPASWAMGILAVWAALAGIALLRLAVGLAHLRKVRRESRELKVEDLSPLVRATLEEFQSTRAVKLAVSDELQVPTAMGFFKPLVVLPGWAVSELSAEEMNSILIHELAHLRRRDDWTNLAQKLVHAVLFFHPAVWWVEKQLSLEREMACDDFVLSQTSDPRAYAECLVAVAEKSFMRRGLALAQAAVGRLRQTTLRVTRILDGNRRGAVRVWKPAVGLLAVSSMCVAAGLAHAPELVAFQDSAVSLPTTAKTMPAPAIAKTVKPVVVAAKAKAPAVPRVVMAGDMQLAPPLPPVLQAKLAQLPEQMPPGVDSMMVVLQEKQWDPEVGAWKISTWHFTVVKADLKPEQVPAGLLLPAKQI